MSDGMRTIDHDGRTLLLDAIDARWYVFEVVEDGYDLIGAIADHGDAFLVECFWRPLPDATTEARTIDEGVRWLVEHADEPASALAFAHVEQDLGP